MRKCYTFIVADEASFMQKLVLYCEKLQFGTVLNSCNYRHDKYASYEVLAGIGEVSFVAGSFDKINEFKAAINDWMFGCLSYDLKNEVENLYSVNTDSLYFPLSVFFQPRYVVKRVNTIWTVEYIGELDTEDVVVSFIKSVEQQDIIVADVPIVEFQRRITRDDYIHSVNSILDHIHKGDIYELNFCQEFFQEQVTMSPYHIYNKLVEISPTPFSAFVKLSDKYIISASPERYLKKDGRKLISQPIKGTAPRGCCEMEDEQFKSALMSCVKERSENVMIADLVRNDLSRVASKGSVAVEELCNIYAFPQVFQMITTVVAELAHDSSAFDAISKSFPMGSMTGAPKVRAMKLIEKYEDAKRGTYSGAVGYFSPEGDFDFNVVIRSLLYNATNKYLSFMVGSAITEKSKPEQEYDECLVKAKAIFKLFENKLK